MKGVIALGLLAVVLIGGISYFFATAHYTDYNGIITIVGAKTDEFYNPPSCDTNCLWSSYAYVPPPHVPTHHYYTQLTISYNLTKTLDTRESSWDWNVGDKVCLHFINGGYWTLSRGTCSRDNTGHS